MNKLKYIITLVITLILFISLPTSVYADNAGGGGSGAVDGSNIGGASQDKSGFRMYVVDENGVLQSKVIDLVYKQPQADIAGNTTRLGNGTVNIPSDVYIMPTDMPRPFIYNGGFVGNGITVREWMRSRGDNGAQHIVNLIHEYMGENVESLFAGTTDSYYLILEDICWHNIYTTEDASSNSGVCFYGTFYNWMQFYAANGMANGGFTRTLDNNVLGRCLVLQNDQTNFNLVRPTSTGSLDLNVVGNQGFGMQIYWNLEILNDAQTTFDENCGDTPDKAPDESNGATNIVKNYRLKKSDGTYTDEGCFLKSNTSNTIKIEDEVSYKVVGWKTSNKSTYPINSVSWNVPGTISQQGTSSQTVTLNNSTEKTLYVLLEKSEEAIVEEFDGDYKLGESQITRRISLGTTDKGENILQGHKFKWLYGALNGQCGGHTHYNTCNCTLDEGESCTANHSYTTYCNWTLDDNSFTVAIKNDKFTNYPKNIAATSAWSDNVTGNGSATRTGLNAGNFEKEFGYNVVLHRGSDALSIAEWKNTNSALDSLDNFNTVNSKNASRKKNDYTESVNFNFVDNSSDKNTSSDGDEGCEHTDTARLDSGLSKDVSILYETYSGKENTITNTRVDNSPMMIIGSTGNQVRSGKMVSSGLQFSFHPYVQMRYDTIDSTNNLVYVLGEYKRTIQPNDYAEISWEKTQSPNLELHSNQWSIHNQAATDKGVGNVLPGGATLTLGIKKQSRQIVTVTTYQTILDGDGRTQVEKTSASIDGYTKDTALQYHELFVQSVANGLDNLSVAQYQNTDDMADPFEGLRVFNESDISELNNGNSISSAEDKYYFKSNTDDNGTNEGDLDVKIGNANTVYYTFSSDASGNILMNGTVILTKNQGVQSLSGIASQINARTLVVSKLVDALERNAGNDSGATWVSDGKWYNEIFDGITVAVSATQIETGFVTPGERMTVQDPKLNTKSSGTASLFKDANGNPSYNVCAFKMNDFSHEYGAENTIGLFKDTEVKMMNMDMLYYSRSWYISNLTTQELH